MTNGEMIQKMFPSINFGTLASEDLIVNRDYSANDEPQVFIPKRVWDSEYKESIKALEQEPTTKNDLGVLEKIRAEIEPKCDRINSLASVLPYTAHREIQELLCEIMDLCKAESEDKE